MTDWQRLETDYIEAVQECLKGDEMDINPWESTLDHLKLRINGSKNTPYKNGVFIFEIRLGNYPWDVPAVYCHTKIWHPNILNNQQFRSSSGTYIPNICHSLIDPNQKNTHQGWKGPGSSLNELIISLRQLLNIGFGWDIPPNDPGLNNEAAVQWRSNKQKFKKIASEWTRTYA